ncbi:MAG: Sec-independent protein translocase subunit TatA, partial [Brachybacterium tyrofermentans]
EKHDRDRGAGRGRTSHPAIAVTLERPAERRAGSLTERSVTRPIHCGMMCAPVQIAAQLKGNFMGMFKSPWAIVVVILVVVLLFGANKLPGLARNMGKSMRIFKTEVEEMRGDDKKDEDDDIDEPRRSARDDRPRDDRPRDDRQYNPRDEAEREPVRPREDGDSYRRD